MATGTGKSSRTKRDISIHEDLDDRELLADGFVTPKLRDRYVNHRSSDYEIPFADEPNTNAPQAQACR